VARGCMLLLATGWLVFLTIAVPATRFDAALASGRQAAEDSSDAERSASAGAASIDGDRETNLPGRDGNEFHTSQLSQTLSAAFQAFPQERYADLYEKYLGIRHTISTTESCGGWIPESAIRSGSTLDRVLNSGVLRIGFVYHAPYLYLDESGNPVGFEYELAYGLLDLIQGQYPARPLRIEWKPVEYTFSGSGQENIELADALVQQLQSDAFDVVLSGIIAQPDRPVATACPDMDFYWDAIYTGRGNLDLRPVQYTDRQRLIAFLVDHPGMSLVSTAGGPSEEAVDAIVADVRQAGGSISSRTVSAAELPGILTQQTDDFAIGDGIALFRECHLHNVRSRLHWHAHFPVAVGAIARLLPLPAAAASRAARTRPGAATLPSSGRLRGVGIACCRGLARRRARRRGGTRQREYLDALTVYADLEILRLHIDRDLLVQVARELDAHGVPRVHREGVADRRASARAEQLPG